MERKKVTLYAAFFIGIFIVIFLPGFSELQKLREENRDSQKRMEILVHHNEVLKEEIQRMKQDPDYMEKKAREKLGIVKKGEIVYKGSK